MLPTTRPGAGSISRIPNPVRAQPQPEAEEHSAHFFDVLKAELLDRYCVDINYWTLPWHLAKEAHLEGRREWPPALFALFLDAIKEDDIARRTGSHAFLDVLFVHRAALSPAQRQELKATLRENRPPGASRQAAQRLREFLDGNASELVRTFGHAVCLAKDADNPQPELAICSARSLFKTFSTACDPSDARHTVCITSTTLTPSLQFTVDMPKKQLDGLLADYRPPEEGGALVTSLLAKAPHEQAILGTLDEILKTLPAYDLQRRNATFLALPAALAQTQSRQRHGWSAEVFDSYIKVLDDYAASWPVSLCRFLDVLKDAASTNRLSPSQREDAVRWVQQNMDRFGDPVSQRSAAELIAEACEPKEAMPVFTQLQNLYRSGLQQAWHINYAKCAAGVAAAGFTYLAKVEAETKAEAEAVASTPRARMSNAGRRFSDVVASVARSLTPRSLSGTPSPRGPSQSSQGDASPQGVSVHLPRSATGDTKQ